MINILTQLSRYVLLILAVIYAIKCFTVFRSKHAWDRGSIYMTQNILMYMIHFICYLLIFLNEREVKILGLYLAEVIFFTATLVLYSSLYKHASRLLVNNMCFLMMIGFVMLTRLDYDSALKQFLIAVVSVGLSLIIPVIIARFRNLGSLGMGIFYGILCFLVLVSVFVIGTSANGATNWVAIGPISFQPSELGKVIFVFFAAAMLCRRTDFKYLVFVSIFAAGFILILAAENDLGAAIIYYMTYLAMVYVASQRVSYLAIGFGGLGAACALGYKLFYQVRVRVSVWLDPWSDYANTGYQIAQSLFAIGTGGWLGLGLYQGVPESIPIVVSDFIFSAICEELGGVFGICIVLVYISCFIMFINISLQLTRPFYKILAIGLSTGYAFQLFLSVGGVIKFIPHTGVTMPLISYGGSSILTTIIIFSVIQGLYLLKRRESEERMNEEEQEYLEQ